MQAFAADDGQAEASFDKSSSLYLPNTATVSHFDLSSLLHEDVPSVGKNAATADDTLLSIERRLFQHQHQNQNQNYDLNHSHNQQQNLNHNQHQNHNQNQHQNLNHNQNLDHNQNKNQQQQSGAQGNTGASKRKIPASAENVPITKNTIPNPNLSQQLIDEINMELAKEDYSGSKQSPGNLSPSKQSPSKQSPSKGQTRDPAELSFSFDVSKSQDALLDRQFDSFLQSEIVSAALLTSS